jgi:hypothetical protein
MNIISLDESRARQYIDSRTVFFEHQKTRKSMLDVRGNMKWKRSGGGEYLIRVASSGGETSLGPRSPETENMFANFMRRKQDIEERLASLKQELDACQRRNRAEGVGRAPDILVKILNRLEQAGLADHFIVVGTHALYAYEQAAGVTIQEPDALATRDADLLWDTRKRVQFSLRMNVLDSSMIGLLKDVDSSFRLKDDEKYKAINAKGFEIDIIRREARCGDPHPLKMTDHDDDFWVVQARRASDLLSAPKFSSMIVSPLGSMAQMTTIDPTVFVEFKRWMATLDDRDPLKRRRDSFQADIVERLCLEYLGQQFGRP